jgi:hypothetical protein
MLSRRWREVVRVVDEVQLAAERDEGGPPMVPVTVSNTPSLRCS